MAITINEGPQLFQPAYNPLTYVVTSDKTAEANFQYVLDLYITGVSTPSFFRMLKPADASQGGRAYFDIGETIKNYLSFDILKTDIGWATCGNSIVEYQAKFGESFGAATSGVTVYTNLTVDTARYSWNSVFDPPDFRTFDDATYLLASSSANFLTNRPATAKVWRGEDAWIYMITSGSNVAETLRLRTYDTDGALIATWTKTNPFATINAVGRRMLRHPAGDNLNDEAWVEIGSNQINANVFSYDITILNSSGAASSEVYTFTISRDCAVHTIYTLHFLNKLGGFDTFTFIKRSDFNMNIERANYKKILGGLAGDSTKAAATWGYDNSDRGKVTYTTKIKDRVMVNSDWVDESTQNWLEELVGSPEIFLDHPTYGFVAINPLNATFEKKQSINEKLFNLTFEFEYGYDRVRQSR